MSEYIPTTDEVQRSYWRGTALRSADHIKEDAAFERWLKQVKAEAWREGFDAGEQDVWGHEHNEDGWDADCISNPYLEEEKSADDAVEKGYRLLAEDPEMFQRRQSHRCGFDFLENQATAKCKCGVVSTNPFWTFRGDN